MIKDYLPILLQALVAIGFAAGSLTFSVLIGRAGKRNAVKDSPYECGMLPEGTGHSRFAIKFYLVAMLFILFDIEIVFMYPWAVVFRDYIGSTAPETAKMILWSMLSFVGILMAGYVYALRKGALSWRH
jgi:NADH-quinone oxidoreductase subunit A